MTTSKFTEAKLELAIIEILQRQDHPNTHGTDLERFDPTCQSFLLRDLWRTISTQRRQAAKTQRKNLELGSF